MILCFVSIGSTVAAIENGHWFAAPFAALFAFGYGYVATLLTAEPVERRRAVRRSLVPTMWRISLGGTEERSEKKNR